jgi:hypothetical protein
MILKRLVGCLLAVLLVSSCIELVQSEFPDFDPFPVVLCILREGEPLEMRLSWTAKIDDSPLRFIEDAQVRLYADDEYIETLIHRAAGIYDAATVVASLVRYTCEIDIPGLETIVVTDLLPSAVVPFDVHLIPVSMRTDEGKPVPAVRFTFANNPNERRYYEAVIWEVHEEYESVLVYDPRWGEWWDRVPTGNTILYAAPFYHQFTDPVLKSEGLQIAVFSNEHIKGDEYTMTINFGVGYSKYNNEPWIARIHPTILELRSVSYDYYRYARQRHLYEVGFAPEFGKPAPVFNLFSNIKNGFGIFAGYAAVRSDEMNIE